MHTLMKPRSLAMLAAVMIGTFVGSWATASPTTPAEDSASATRQCTQTLCPNLLWLRAPILRVHAR
jgi:hypothetical protein